ncbi:hypothetical protein [Opitutus terrae]|uniref:Rhamnogalacturonan lyase family 11 C-terminal domain-containing protein n=1 Tax=Opitutus terrae (strain DSM 11246 / JCM 15787 / PB90-1) TaxID=452637 RepID=B1ZPS1_OPITP|nr:hypothetical protein [Opitutus terrae]ACB75524.1 conserved hypothetical protein [Opitutus terrae PB90-1]
MKAPLARAHLIATLLLTTATLPLGARTAEAVLFEDDFSTLTGLISSDVVGAHAEYHYLPATAPRGNWAVSCFRSNGSQRAWRALRDREGVALAQTYTSTAEEAAYTHPLVIAGDPLWQDYTLTVRFTPAAGEAQSGIVFRYQNDRCYYFFGVRAGRALLKSVQHADSFRTAREVILADATVNVEPGEELVATVTVQGSNLTATLNNRVRLAATDTTFAAGKVGLLADRPTLYRHVRVAADRASAAAFRAARATEDAIVARLQAANPPPRPWRKIATDGFGTGRQLRFGDLDGDGVTDLLFVQVKRHGPKDRNSEVGCLTAVSLDGRQLWQVGEPDPWNDVLTNDVAVQIADLDGRAGAEVVYAKGQRLIVADGATGRTLREIATPPNRARAPYNRTPHVLGDAIAIVNVRGLSSPRDIFLKDRYEHFWVYNEQLELLWSARGNLGHYPHPQDIDGDGRDEIYLGYSLYDDDGRVLWSREDRLQDHADGVAVIDLDLNPSTPPVLINAASDEGMVFLSANGEILRQHFVGHVQNPVTANFRDDLPGLETYTINFWGNQGIVHLFDARGDPVLSFEPAQHGSMMLPVNWTGRSEEFFLLSTNVTEGGLFDGRGRRVLVFPADGHPELANAVLDLTGDCRDEIITWDASELWIYTQDDSPKSGRLYRPQRRPTWQESNYSAAVSLSGWTDDSRSSQLR